MSQQAAAGRGAGAGRSGGRRRYGPRGRGLPQAQPKPTKNDQSPITEISQHTFNTGDNGHAAQFTESREKIATYIQRCGWDESYLVAETIRSGTAQKIGLPPQVDPNDPLGCYLLKKSKKKIDPRFSRSWKMTRMTRFTQFTLAFFTNFTCLQRQ